MRLLTGEDHDALLADSAELKRLKAAIAQPVHPDIQACIEAARVGEDPEDRDFAIECAGQYGFEYVDDDATIMVATTDSISNLMQVLGYGRKRPDWTMCRDALPANGQHVWVQFEIPMEFHIESDIPKFRDTCSNQWMFGKKLLWKPRPT